MTATDLSPNAHVLVLQELRSRFTDAGIPSRTAALDAAISALATHQPVVQEPVELLCVAQTLANGAGQWRTCTGCHESNEGMPTGPYSSIMKCYLGNGCDECGGIGAVWDTTDYKQMADEMAKSLAAPPVQAVDLAQFRVLAAKFDGLGDEEVGDAYSGPYYQCAVELRALIDSQEMGREPNSEPNRLTDRAIDADVQKDAARWRAIAPHLQVEWDEDELLKRWTWIDFKRDALSVPSRTRESYASLNEAMDAVINSQAVGK